jgi:hypothetical protein
LSVCFSLDHNLVTIHLGKLDVARKRAEFKLADIVKVLTRGSRTRVF